MTTTAEKLCDDWNNIRCYLEERYDERTGRKISPKNQKILDIANMIVDYQEKFTDDYEDDGQLENMFYIEEIKKNILNACREISTYELASETIDFILSLS